MTVENPAQSQRGVWLLLPLAELERGSYLAPPMKMSHRWFLWVAVVVLGSGMPSHGVNQSLPDPVLRQQVQAAIAATLPSRSAAEQQDLMSFYRSLTQRPAWLDEAGRPSPQASAALALLERAGADGLSSRAYGIPATWEMARGLTASSPPAADAARFDVALSAGMLRYLRHLHLGQIDPHTLGWQIAARVEGHDFAAGLRTAIGRNRISELANDFAPPLFQYRALRGVLARYQTLASEQNLALPAFGVPLKPGTRFAALPQLHRLLVTLGDVPETTPVPATGIYDAAIVAGIAHFQARHGLPSDGVIDRATEAALRVPLTTRARQIALALERLRWLPDIGAGPLLAVNIPMFRLWAWSGEPGTAKPALSMGVIVGRALRTRTPMFVDQMEHVIFRPYWNIPSSILRGESLPAIRKDLTYLTRQNLEIVDGPSDNSPVLPPTPANIARLASGNVRLRQRPGPFNALGLLKFVFPNENNVYMHDTPGIELFKASRRDFSHGCIRVEDPAALAAWLLRDDPDWTSERIAAATTGAPNQRVVLDRPVPVIIFYTTAAVLPEEGLVHFADDIYRQDQALEVALGPPR